MRTYKFRTLESVKNECLSLFPTGNITKHDRQTNRGLFLWINRNMEDFNSAYKYIYNKEYIDKRTVVDKTGKNNGRYIDGRYPETMRIRKSKKMKEWRLMVFGRDNFTCQNCGKKGCYLEAHHIKSFSAFPELRFVVSNGITWCRLCHNKLDKYRGKRGDNHQNL